jgi:hypothetical protein
MRIGCSQRNLVVEIERGGSKVIKGGSLVRRLGRQARRPRCERSRARLAAFRRILLPHHRLSHVRPAHTMGRRCTTKSARWRRNRSDRLQTPTPTPTASCPPTNPDEPTRLTSSSPPLVPEYVPAIQADDQTHTIASRHFVDVLPLLLGSAPLRPVFSPVRLKIHALPRPLRVDAPRGPVAEWSDRGDQRGEDEMMMTMRALDM